MLVCTGISTAKQRRGASSAWRRFALEVSPDGLAFYSGAVNRRRVYFRISLFQVPFKFPGKGASPRFLGSSGSPAGSVISRRARYRGDHRTQPPFVASTVATCGICATHGGLRQPHLKKHCQRRLAVLWLSSLALPSNGEHSFLSSAQHTVQ